MEKGRRSVATAEEKLALLRKIDEREEKTEAARKMRADSVLGDLRKARFRHLARMAQKRLQSVLAFLTHSPIHQNAFRSRRTCLKWRKRRKD